MTKRKSLLNICIFAFSVNILLFFIKLYVGLSSNSIAIFSDSINNMFDGLSGLISFAFIYFIGKETLKQPISTIQKSEQLLSFLISLIITITAFYFAYSSVERLMYPTPIWYQIKYLILICFTSAVKLLMYFYYKFREKRNNSPVISVMKTDSLLDFFINLVTVISLTLSQFLSFTFDALFGIIISVIILIEAIKLISKNTRLLINYRDKEKDEIIENILVNDESIESYRLFDYFIQNENEISENCEIKFKENLSEKDAEEIILNIKSNAKEKTGINLNLLRQNNGGKL